MYQGQLRAVKKIIAKEYEKEMRACTKKYGLSIDQLDEQLDQQLNGLTVLSQLLDDNLGEIDRLLGNDIKALDKVLRDDRRLESIFDDLASEQKVLIEALDVDLDGALEHYLLLDTSKHIGVNYFR